ARSLRRGEFCCSPEATQTTGMPARAGISPLPGQRLQLRWNAKHPLLLRWQSNSIWRPGNQPRCDMARSGAILPKHGGAWADTVLWRSADHGGEDTCHQTPTLIPEYVASRVDTTMLPGPREGSVALHRAFGPGGT